MTDKRQKDTKVKYKHDESITKCQYFWNIFFSRRSIWVLQELVHRWTQHFTKIDQEKRKIEQICILHFGTPWLSIHYVNLIYVISMAVFTGYWPQSEWKSSMYMLLCVVEGHSKQIHAEGITKFGVKALHKFLIGNDVRILSGCFLKHSKAFRAQPER